MNRRHFLSTLGAAGAAASILKINPALGATEATTAFYAKGLILVSFEDAHFLRLGFPKAAGHKATLALVPESGTQKTLSLKSNGTVETKRVDTGKRDFKVPELIRMQEIYGNKISSRVAECPLVISIPYSAIRSISASEVSPTRYTFVRADNGQEVNTFRPRQIAETLKIELLSDSILKLDGGKSAVALNSMKEVHAQYTPDSASSSDVQIDAFAAHFPHYYAYLDRPQGAGFDVVPKKLGGNSSTTPKVGNRYMMYFPYTMCFVVAV